MFIYHRSFLLVIYNVLFLTKTLDVIVNIYTVSAAVKIMKGETLMNKETHELKSEEAERQEIAKNNTEILFDEENDTDEVYYYPGSFIAIENECTTCAHFYRGCCTSANDNCKYEPN